MTVRTTGRCGELGGQGGLRGTEGPACGGGHGKAWWPLRAAWSRGLHPPQPCCLRVGVGVAGQGEGLAMAPEEPVQWGGGHSGVLLKAPHPQCRHSETRCAGLRPGARSCRTFRAPQQGRLPAGAAWGPNGALAWRRGLASPAGGWPAREGEVLCKRKEGSGGPLRARSRCAQTGCRSVEGEGAAAPHMTLADLCSTPAGAESVCGAGPLWVAAAPASPSWTCVCVWGGRARGPLRRR